MPNIFMGVGLMIYGLTRDGLAGRPVAGRRVRRDVPVRLAMAYSFMLMLASTAVWMVRNQSLYEMWWLFTSLMRYPKEIFRGGWASRSAWLFTFLIPVLLVSNVPARTLAKALEPWLAGYMVLATVVSGGVEPVGVPPAHAELSECEQLVA